jgi:hypothetical protein
MFESLTLTLLVPTMTFTNSIEPASLHNNAV